LTDEQACANLTSVKKNFFIRKNEKVARKTETGNNEWKRLKKSG